MRGSDNLLGHACHTQMGITMDGKIDILFKQLQAEIAELKSERDYWKEAYHEDMGVDIESCPVKPLDVITDRQLTSYGEFQSKYRGN